MSRQLVVVDVGPLKPLITAASAGEGLRASPWVRRLIEQALQAEPVVGAAHAAAHRKPAADDVKLTVRLTAQESAALVAAARNAHLSQAEFVARVVATPGAGAALTQALQVLAESNRHLLSLGRNLNQVVHKINAAPGTMTEPDRALILEAAAATRTHARLVAEALSELTATRRSRARVPR
jgi:hypothetical protein